VLTKARLLGKHTAIAKVDAENAASIGLCKTLGFREAARLREIGFKNGVRVTVVYMQIMLSEWNGIPDISASGR
jgi:L-amino acid N-acyltransferase